MTPYNFEENQLRIEEDKKRKIRQAYIAQQDKTKWSSVLVENQYGGGGLVDSTPYQPPLVQTLNPDVQNVFANLGVGQKRIPNLEKVAKEAAPAATGKMDYLSLLKILGMVNSPQATSNVNKGITPGVTPGVAGSRIQEEDLYARYRR